MIYRKKSNLKFFKYFDQRSIGSLPRIFLSSLIVFIFFYSTPILINYIKEKSNSYQNNSKAILAYTLKNKGKNFEDVNNDPINEKDLLRDIFSLNDLETDTIHNGMGASLEVQSKIAY